MITAINRLSKQIDAEVDLRLKSCLMARQGMYFAREGKFEAAAATSRTLRREFKGKEFLELTCWLCLLDGISIFYKKPDSNAFDRFRIAYELSRSIKNSEVGVASAAWLAYIEFNRGCIQRSCVLNGEALESAQRGYAGSLARISLTIGSTFNYCGAHAAAQSWYDYSRKFALEDGDRVAVSAVLHNAAAFRIHRARLEKFCRFGNLPDNDLLTSILGSSINYDRQAKVSVLALLEPIVLAQLYVVEGRFVEALSILSKEVEYLVDVGLGKYRALVLSDILLCKSSIETSMDLAELVDEILVCSLSIKEHDELAIVFGQMSMAYSNIGDIPMKIHYDSLSGVHLGHHINTVCSLSGSPGLCDLDSKHWEGTLRD
jgi:hypothetical protein